MKKTITCLLSTMLILSLLTGCLIKNKLRVYTTTYPMNFLATTIGDKYIEVINVSEGSMIQTASFKKEYINDFKSGDLFLYIQGLEPYMPMYIDRIRETKIQMFDASLYASGSAFSRFTVVQSEDGVSSATLQSPFHVGPAFNGVDVYDMDPFLWMDPVLMISIAEQLKDKFVEMDRSNAKFYERNFEALKVKLARLDAEYSTFSKQKGNPKVVTMTNTYGNWQKSYYVHVYPVMISRFGLMPNEEQYLAIKERIIKDEVRFIADEPGMTEEMNALFERLATEAGLTKINLHHLSFLTPEEIQNNADYITIMYENLANLKLVE